MPTDKQLAANRANAARSTGPRTPAGKAAASRNARKHAFCPGDFIVACLESDDDIVELRADLIAVYRPVNPQETLAIERIAIAQQNLHRASRLEAGLFGSCLDQGSEDARIPPNLLMSPTAPREGIAMDRGQLNNISLAQGFQRMASSRTWNLFLRYQAQTERLYRRAVEDFERLKSLRPELAEADRAEAEAAEQEFPNEPNSAPQLQQSTTASTRKNEPIFDRAEPARPQPSGRNRHLQHHSNAPSYTKSLRSIARSTHPHIRVRHIRPGDAQFAKIRKTA